MKHYMAYETILNIRSHWFIKFLVAIVKHILVSQWIARILWTRSCHTIQRQGECIPFKVAAKSEKGTHPSCHCIEHTVLAILYDSEVHFTTVQSGV